MPSIMLRACPVMARARSIIPALFKLPPPPRLMSGTATLVGLLPPLIRTEGETPPANETGAPTPPKLPGAPGTPTPYPS